MPVRLNRFREKDSCDILSLSILSRGVCHDITNFAKAHLQNSGHPSIDAGALPISYPDQPTGKKRGRHITQDVADIMDP
jgi:hypothetical protein